MRGIHDYVANVLGIMRQEAERGQTKTFVAKSNHLPIINEMVTQLIDITVLGKFKSLKAEFEDDMKAELGDMT